MPGPPPSTSRSPDTHHRERACFKSRLRSTWWGGSRHRRAFRAQHPSYDPILRPKSGTHPISTVPTRLCETGPEQAVLGQPPHMPGLNPSLGLQASAGQPPRTLLPPLPFPVSRAMMPLRASQAPEAILDLVRTLCPQHRPTDTTCRRQGRGG